MRMDHIYETPKKYRFDDSKIVKKALVNLNIINYRNSHNYKDFKKAYRLLLKYLVKENRNVMIHFNAQMAM